LHQTKQNIPKNGIIIDATAPLARVIDEILHLTQIIPTHRKIAPCPGAMPDSINAAGITDRKCNDVGGSQESNQG